MPRDIEPPERFGWPETALMLGCSVRHLQQLKSDGQIGYTTVGKGPRPKVFFTRQDIDEYLASREVKVKPRRRTAG